MSLERFARQLKSVIPDPFVIAIGLTLAAFSFGLMSGIGPTELAGAWVDGHEANGAQTGGLWSLLTFAMQMCLILVTGYVVASTPAAQTLLRKAAAIPQSTAQAAVLISVVAMGLALFNWGLGLIAGALLAREVGIGLQQRGVPVHYPLLAASGYTGLCVWHGGFSGSAPLKVTDMAGLIDVLGAELAQKVGTLPLSQTILSPRNLAATGLVFILVPCVLSLMVPKDPALFQPAPQADIETRPSVHKSVGLAGWLERSPLLSVLLVGLIGLWMIPWAVDGGIMRLNPNTMNLCFLAIGLLCAGGPLKYMQLAERAAAATGGIIVQFPLYGGILGLLAAGGVVEALSGWLPTTAGGLGLFTFGSAGAFNLFVPSGGGQWAVQGPIVMAAAVQNGIDPGRIVMALSWGDQWTNLFQPFWALPLLGITGARAADILGYTMVLGVAVGLVFGLAAYVG
jgi:short-chain fatty acids transporter